MKNYIRAHRGILLIPLSIIILPALLTVYLLKAYSAEISSAYRLALSQTSVLMSTRETVSLQAYPETVNEKMIKKAAAKLAEAQLSFESSDPQTVSVSPDGLITPHAAGEADITVTFSELSAVCHVEAYVPIDDIRLDQKDLSLNVSESAALKVVITPEDATLHDEASFVSSAPEIVSVSENGTVSALSPGEADITLTFGDYRDTCHVQVFSPLTGISLDEPEPVTLNRGETRQFSTSVTPENTTDDTTVTYTVSDESIGTIDETGLFTALNAGDVTVTAQVGGFTDSCPVHIVIPLEGIYLGTAALTMRWGDSVQIPIGYTPYDTTEDLTTVWTSTDPNVVSVNEAGIVTALNAGRAVVTASCQNFTAAVEITVIIPVTGVVISSGAMTLNKGASGQLYAALEPANTTEEPYITWSSDRIDVATVTNGLVTAVGAGTAVIYASHDDYRAACTVTVLSPMTGIRFDQAQITVVETCSAALSLSYEPLDTTDPKDVIWSTDDPSIAAVADGIITGVSEGTCTVFAQVGIFTATAQVTVTPFISVESVTLDRSSLAFEMTGTSQLLTASVLPENASGSGVSFSSSDSSVATVSENGLVTAVRSGDCVITASCGGKSASCTVHVAAGNMVVVLDPGHDSMHCGAYYAGIREELINMTVAQSCKAYLETHYAGVTVLLTRGDGPLAGALRDDLEARAQFAQANGADVLVSMHFNVSLSHSASGSVAYVSKQPNVVNQSVALANSILAQISGTTGLLNRGCEMNNSDTYFDEFGNPLDYYAINRHCANRGIPGIIIEHCFMDVDTAFTSSPEWLAAFGAADAIGIASYLGLAPR